MSSLGCLFSGLLRLPLLILLIVKVTKGRIELGHVEPPGLLNFFFGLVGCLSGAYDDVELELIEPQGLVYLVALAQAEQAHVRLEHVLLTHAHKLRLLDGKNQFVVFQMEASGYLHAARTMRLQLFVVEVVADELVTVFVFKLHLDTLAVELSECIIVR